VSKDTQNFLWHFYAAKATPHVHHVSVSAALLKKSTNGIANLVYKALCSI
jgi:hypothetical protein